jgi:hypothetical protein
MATPQGHTGKAQHPEWHHVRAPRRFGVTHVARVPMPPDIVQP